MGWLLLVQCGNGAPFFCSYCKLKATNDIHHLLSQHVLFASFPASIASQRGSYRAVALSLLYCIPATPTPTWQATSACTLGRQVQRRPSYFGIAAKVQGYVQHTAVPGC